MQVPEIITGRFCENAKIGLFRQSRLEYANPESHFSFSIPRNWQQIPSEVIDQVIKAALSQISSENPNFEAGFQETADYFIRYPYLLIKSYPADRGSISKIAKSFSASNFEKAAERLETTALIRNFTSGNPVVDSKRKMVMIGTNLEVANIGPIRSLTAISPGRESVVEFYFYTRLDEYEDDLSVFDQILDSFRFESGFEYRDIHPASTSSI